ncbi:MAG: right-handed parallel beta-helix repeat-containing protein, partial [Candidatus Norongarragalinales archaeon]
SSNLIDGKPIYYYVDQPDLRLVSLQPGMIYCVNCPNALIANNSFNSPNGGIVVLFTRNASIEYNAIRETKQRYKLGGIMLSPGFTEADGSDYVKIKNNFLDGCYNGIRIAGVYWDYAVGNEVTGNVIRNTFGVAVSLGYFVTNLLVTRNTISRATVGMSLSGGTTIDAEVKQNTIADCRYGLQLIYGSGVRFFHNQVIRSSRYAVFVDNPPAEISFDLQGNYWGRSERPWFIPTVDSNDARVKDSCPYNRFYAEGKWPASPACLHAVTPPVSADSAPRRKPAAKLA